MKKIHALTSKFLIATLLWSLSALAISAAEVILIPAGIDVPGGSTNWRYRLGTSEASTPIPAWRTNTFVENATWNTGALPLGFVTGTPNDPNGYEAKLVTTVPAATTNVFLRKTFVVTNRAAYSAIRLGVMVDDGMVAWVNGREVMRFQCCVGGTNPDVPTFNSAATTANESTTNSSLQVADISGPLIDGTNVLAIQLFNANTTSSDLVLDAILIAIVDDQPPTIANRTPSAGSTVQQLNSVEVVFSEAVNGVDAADLQINGVAATNVIVASPTTFTWVFSQPPTGTVNVAFAPAHGISDLAQPPNSFTGGAWTYTLNTNIILPQFFITEFMAANSGDGVNAIRDEDGDGSDWIEIYNSEQSVGNIGGWFLTDATNNLTKWRIPNGATIPGRGYLVVFASGKNRTNVVGRLHTNFQLNNGGEYLALLNPLTNIISEFSPTYPAQQDDISYGRDRVNFNLIGYYTVPTPGSNNVSSGLGFGPEVHFSYTNGTFINPFNLTLSVDDSNSVIRYTIVNTAQNVSTATNIPTATSTLYSGPILVNGTMQVRARAFPTNSGFFPGPPRTESYIQIDGGATNFTSDLPIVVIHTLGTTTISGGFPALDNSVIIQCFDNVGGIASLNKPPQLVTRAGINLRGSSTQGYPKGSYAVELWDEFNNDAEKSFLGLPKESDWVLYAPNAFDLSLMHNPIMHKFARDMGYYSSRTRFVEVFYRNGAGALTADTNATGAAMGNYHGVYVLEEKVKRDGNRVDIDRLEPEHTNSTTITGGWLVKIDRIDPNERTFSGGGQTLNYQDPDGLEMVPPINPGRAAQAAYITAYFNNMNAGLAGSALTNIASTNHYSNYLDVDATIDMNIVNVATMNVDGYRLSGYIYKPRGGKLVFGPVWDVDRGLGTSRGDLRAFNPRAWQAWDPLGGSDYGTDFFAGTTPPNWLGRWFADVDFWQRWVDRYQFWRASALDTNHVTATVDGFRLELRQAQVREQKRWGGNGASDTNPRTGVVNAGGGVYSHTFPGTFQGEVDFQKKWLVEHIHFMDTNLLNRPSLPSPEGQIPLGTLVSITENSGKVGTRIYYTVDGSDPRGFQGTTNPAALLYNGPITITNNVRIRARAVNSNHRNLTGVTGPGSHGPVVSTPWSGDIASTYYITPPRLVITELMYHPAPAPAGNTNDADNYEFIELKNVGNTALNLAGFRFTEGIDFTFSPTGSVTTLAPGASVLVVKHLAAFNSRYGVQPNVAGVYNGNLANEGERIALVGPRQEPILDFTYSDNWYPVTDGFGWSLVFKDPTASPGSWEFASNWRASASAGGSPGVDDPAAPAFGQILINEALTHTDLPVLDQIELFNAGTSDVNIGGWFLTDDPTADIKYVIPAATVIPAGGFVVFDESQFTNGPTGFSLSSDSDELYLFSAAAGEPTGYSHGFEFGAAQNGVTFGRYVNSQGAEHFVAQATNTLGASNSLPRVGPVVISEIMYHPPDFLLGGAVTDNSIDEFVELYNLTTTNVPLYDVSNPSNTWRLTSAVDFNFPTNTSIAPNSFVLVVNFNPTNAAQLAAFRGKYGVPVPGGPIFGPYEGQLDNSAESVRLRRPDAPNTNGVVPYILVDQIDYVDEDPWSKAADGIGASLQRIVLSAYGNDPTNWVAAVPSAAAISPGGTPPSITQQPANATAFVGRTTNFIVGVSGAGVRVQWRLNGTPIPGATNTTLTLGSVQYQHSGFYDVVAYNSGGAVFSSSAFLSVLTPLTFSLQPVNQFVQPGTNVTLTSSAFGGGPVRYQWRFEGVDISNATNANYSFTGANLDDHHGNFSVRVFDDFGFLDSTNAFIYVLVRPAFTIQPVPVTVVQGGTAIFSVMATGAPPLFYRWIRNGVGIQTSTVPVLVLTNVQIGNPNPVPIRAAVTNYATGAGGVNSLTVQLTVHADADGDGVGDPWELQYGFATNNTADGALDFDGDGASNRDEYVAGTNPTDALSVLKLFLSATNDQVLEFVAQSNISYTVQYRTNLLTAPWTGLTNVVGLINTVRTVQVTASNPPPNPEKYYRVVTPLVP